MRRFPGRRDPEQASDGGFTLIELLIACAVIFVVMTSLAYGLTSALKIEAFTTQRQTASALADGTVEQVRALPFAEVAAGLSSSNIAAGGCATTDTLCLAAPADTNIQGSAAPYTFKRTGEQIESGSSSSTPAPLNPYRRSASIGGTVYTIATYVTQPSSSICSSCYRVTVVVSWTPTEENTGNQISTQTVMASPSSGCLGTNTHPFAAPCNPFFYAQTTTAAGGITITPAGSSSPAVSDPGNGGTIPLTLAQLGPAHDDSTLQIEQTSEVTGNAYTSEAELTTSSGYSGTGGGAAAAATADSDPANQSNMSAPTTVNQAAPVSVSQSTGTGPANSLTLTTSNGDTGTVLATTSANPASECYDLSSMAQTTGLPCASNSIRQEGTGTGPMQTTNGTMTAVLNLSSPGSPLGSATLASIAPPTGASSAFAARYQSTGGGSNECTSPTGDGCVHAGAKSLLGTVQLGGLPTALPPPPGWLGYMVQVSGYTAQVSAESGGGAANPTASCSYSISYWNGTGYTAVPVPTCTAAATAFTPATYSTTATIGGKSVTFTESSVGPFSVGGYSTSTGSGNASANVGTLAGTITYTITVNGSSVASLSIDANLGSVLAQTNYQAAPSAS